jgi:hypothetical protein
MSAFSNAAEASIMQLIFTATAWANYADNASASPQTNIHVALATADYTDTGTMSSNEVTYTSYARVNVARSGSGWSHSAGSITPASAISFPAGTGGSGTVTHFATGKTGGGATDVIMYGTVSPNISCGNGITPQLTTATTLSLA